MQQPIFNDDKLGFGGKLMAFVGAMLAGTLGFIFDPKAIFDAAELSPMFAFMLIGLWAGLVSYVESESRMVKLLIGTLHAAAHIAALLFVSWLASATAFVPSLLGALLPIPATTSSHRCGMSWLRCSSAACSAASSWASTGR